MECMVINIRNINLIVIFTVDWNGESSLFKFDGSFAGVQFNSFSKSKLYFQTNFLKAKWLSLIYI